MSYLAAGTEAERESLAARGAALAGRRQAWLFDLIQSDPEAALAAAVPVAVRARFPESIQSLLEARLSGRGELGVLIADDFAAQRRDVRREVTLNGVTYDAFVYGTRLAQGSGQSVALWGIALRDPTGRAVRSRLAVHSSPFRPLESGEAAGRDVSGLVCRVSGRAADWRGAPALAEIAGAVEPFCGVDHLELAAHRLASGRGAEVEFQAADSWAQGPKTCLFMRVAFPDDPGEPISEDAAYVLMDSVNQWFVENSYGTTSIIPTVTPLLMLPQPKAWYGIQGSGTLMSDARKAARTAGFDSAQYHWDIVRHVSVPGFGWSGLGFVRGKGTWLQSSSVGVACHELGHNYGLWHANFWNATGDSVIGPGSNAEYGNSFDTMGAASAGNNQFNAAFKNQLDWLPDAFVQAVTQSGVYRLHAFDLAGLTAGRTYALKIRKDYERHYWAEFRQKFTGNRWLRSGILLNWDPWNTAAGGSAGGTHLLDTTPGTPAGKDDSAVIVGRTFSDVAAGVHLTPIGRSGTGDNWIDVAVRLGRFAGNSAPAVVIAADRSIAATGAVVNFSATAADPDGDALAYWWDFGDDTFGPNAPYASKIWNTAGDYVVRCTVSDLQGGTYSRQLLVTIGSPGTLRASGRIVTDTGLPLEGVRVHNGQTGPAYRGTYSDSEGHYILPNLDSGQALLSAVKYGYTLARAGWTNPVALGPGLATDLDWTAVADPVVTVVAVDPDAGEANADPGRFRISRAGPTNATLSVRLARSGTAFLGSDFAMNPAPAGTPLQINIPAGAAFVDIQVIPQPDSVGEGPETVMLTLLEHSAYVLGAGAEAVVTISDDEPAAKPGVSVSSTSSAADNLATEGAGDAGAFTFTRSSGSLAQDLVLFYAIGGSAEPGVDYTALAGVAVIPAGESTTTIALQAIDDLEVETNETIVVTLLADAAYNILGGTATLVIADDDPVTVTITPTDKIAREAGAGTAGFTVTRQGSLAANLAVQYTLGGTASNGVDYITPSGTVTIPAGRASTSFTLTPVNDSVRESDETVVASLLASPVYNVGNPGTATVVIVDDEIPSVTLTVSDGIAAEPGTNTGAFTFTRSGSVTGALLVRFNVSGAARPGVDYAAIGDSIEIPAGATNAVLLIAPLDDLFPETPEKVTLTLLADPAYNAGTTAPQSVTINDDDTGLPTVGFALAASSGSEGGVLVQLVVNLSTNASSVVTVNYSVTGGTATGNGVDYSLSAGTLRFLPSTNQQTLSFPINSDSLVENNETIVISLANPAGAVLDANAIHTYTILDDDRSGAITISAVNARAYESGVTPGLFRITRSGGTGAGQIVRFQVSGTASGPADFIAFGDTAVIPAGASFTDIPLIPVDDATPETNETVTLKLLDAPGARFGSPDTATVIIVDDDTANTLPLVTIEAADSAAAEPGADTAIFTIRRTGETNAPLNVLYTVGGTATSGTDYSSLGTSAIIPAGAFEKSLVLVPRDDTVFEPDETVIVTLTMTGAYRVGLAPSARAVISDNETGVTIQAVGGAAEDGSTNGGFLLTRTGGLASELLVNFSLAGTAGADDILPPGSSAILPAGSNSVFVPVLAVNDALPEGGETVVATLLAGNGYFVAAPSVAALLVLDDEPDLSVIAAEPIAYEGGGDGQFLISRTGSTNLPLVVQYQLTGTASLGTDYTVPTNSVVIPAGARAAAVTITPLDDALSEGTETVRLTLLAAPAYSLFPPDTATLTILDDESNLRPTAVITSPTTNAVRLINNRNALVLAASATDDARPNPPGMLATRWSLASGPGTVIFANVDTTGTVARFSAEGQYQLRFTADDSQLAASANLTVSIGPGSTGNLAPLVSAGLAQTIPLAESALLRGSVSDDGLPAPGAVTSLWVKASGPGTVTFNDPSALETTAVFSEGGAYVLRLIAGDGETATADDIAIHVFALNVVTLEITDGTAAEFAGQSSQGSFGNGGALVLRRVGDAQSELAVRLEYAGTAQAGLDYVELPSVAVFPAGASTLNLQLVPIRDGLPEGQEFAEINVFPDAAYELGAITGGFINIDDAPWDLWRLELFSSAENADPAISGELADPDRDGVPNLLEYAFDTHPWLPDAGAGFTGAFETSGGLGGSAPVYVVRFRQRLVPADLVYEVQVSSDFTNWMTGPEAARELFPRLENPDGVTFTARHQILPGVAPFEPRFARLRVRLQSSPDRPGRPQN